MALVQAQGLRKRCVTKTYTSNVHGIAVQKIEYLFFKEKFSSVEIILKEDFEYAKKLAAEPEFKIFLMGKSPPSDHPYDKVRSFYKGVAWKNSCGRCVNLFQSKEGDVLRIYVELPYIN